MMKKVLSAIGNVFLNIIAVFFLIIIFVGMILSTPIDFIRYRMSAYYKNTKEKYSWHVTSFSPYYRIYNIIHKHNLPVEYVRNAENPVDRYGYFIYNNSLILPDCCWEYTDEKGWWFFEDDEDGNEIEIHAQSYVDECIEEYNNFSGMNTCNFAYILTNNSDIPENAVTQFKNHRIITYKDDDILSALKAIINCER
ncbi:MAG: hypothetical protein IJO29_07205 [Oscillospiraceae bacterium]|nr:hypothetical protein [Oscillospiraceae bacterium]